MHLRGWLAFALITTLCFVAEAKERTWTSTDGRTMRAEFVRELDGEVTFLVAGKLTTIPLDRLSERDQQIVRDLAAGREVPDDPVPEPAPRPDDPFSSPPQPAPAPADSTESESKLPREERVPSLTPRPITPTNRVWTDNQGRKTTAKFVRVFNGQVVLSRAGGPVSLPFFDLIEADQEYVKEVLTSRGEEDLIPTQRAADPTATTTAGGATGDGPPSNRVTGPPFGPMSAAAPPVGYGPQGYGPGSSSADPGSTTVPGSGVPGSGGYGPGGYPPTMTTSPNPYAEQERGAASAMSAAQRQADAAFQAQEDRMNQMMGSSAYPSATPSFQRVPVCSACRATLSDAEAKGKRCPRCGAWWAYDTYHTGNAGTSSKSAAPSGSQFEFLSDPQSKRTFFGGIAVVVTLAVVVAIVIGVLAVAMAIASASRAGKRYDEVG
jgi:hypothetical protein